MSRRTHQLTSLLPSVHIIWFVLSLKRHLRGIQTFLDVGCGAASPARFLTGWSVGMDAHPQSLSTADGLETHDCLVLADAIRLREIFRSKSFDAVIALDLIEHLDREEGSSLIEAMESIGRKLVLVFTPNGFLQQHGAQDDLQDHRSGWEVSDFRSRGFRVYGLGGPRTWRGGYHHLRRRPRSFWGLVALFHSLLIGRSKPETSASLLAVKRAADG